MSDKCPFCRADDKRQWGPTEYLCGTVSYTGGPIARSAVCYETELARKDELLRRAVGLFNKWLYLEKKGLLSCAFSLKTLVRETNVFLQAAREALEGKKCLGT